MKLKLFFILLTIGTIGLVSCGDDDDGGGVNCSNSFSFNAEIQDEVQALTDAALAYGTNPNTETCQAWVEAAQNYLDAVEDLEDCAREVGALAEWNQSIQAAQMSIAEAADQC